MRMGRQYSVGYLFVEVALIAVALAAGRALATPVAGVEGQAVCYCIAMTAGCGAMGGLCLRMALGLIAGGVLAAASLPSLWILISS